jgi:uncharacterized protein YhjY with autotransporter beta-barrel domain
MIIKKSGGRWQLSLLASVVISAFFLNTAYAWQQEYIVDTQPGHSTERYTWEPLRRMVTSKFTCVRTKSKKC